MITHLEVPGTYNLQAGMSKSHGGSEAAELLSQELDGSRFRVQVVGVQRV